MFIVPVWIPLQVYVLLICFAQAQMYSNPFPPSEGPRLTGDKLHQVSRGNVLILRSTKTAQDKGC